ncbi:MAG: anhydro-N-acetylmuramic acid kinase [Burkholderiaceae bacterium]|nr:anhydro-N-acetylmuramic acid kinase [Burkholderiaceae bacterium]
MAWYIGLMSGSSLDGVDGVLAAPDLPQPPRAHVHAPLPQALRRELLALNTPGGLDELHRAALAEGALAGLYAEVVRALLARAALPASAVRAIGAHGQTVRHQPGAFDGIGYTVQLLDGARLAEASGIDVVCDFRRRDLAAGGQGAPLVPAFHAARFGGGDADTAVLNIGGIANLTLLGRDGSVRGLDCGPGNVLMDAWSVRHLGLPYDEGGAWAASAVPDEALLARLLAEPFFARSPPKSTGRDLFHAGWLDAALGVHGALPPARVQATLLELTVRAAADALRRHAPGTVRLAVCGGGAFNDALMARLAARLPGIQVQSTGVLGVPPDQVEALAFAWLAKAFVDGRPGNVPAVTGAVGPRRLGALYPAR